MRPSQVPGTRVPGATDLHPKRKGDSNRWITRSQEDRLVTVWSICRLFFGGNKKGFSYFLLPSDAQVYREAPHRQQCGVG